MKNQLKKLFSEATSSGSSEIKAEQVNVQDASSCEQPLDTYYNKGRGQRKIVVPRRFGSANTQQSKFPLSRGGILRRTAKISMGELLGVMYARVQCTEHQNVLIDK